MAPFSRRRTPELDPDQAMILGLFGMMPVAAWPADHVEPEHEPWNSFIKARELLQGGRIEDAVQLWREIAAKSGLESRHTLQAWSFLRASGVTPPAEVAQQAYGVVAEIPVAKGHDLLVAYRDGAMRYLHHTGRYILVEEGAPLALDHAGEAWLSDGEAMASSIGTWHLPDLPPLKRGDARVMVLTPGGLRFGQGRYAQLSADPLGSAFISAAATVLQLILELHDGAASARTS